MSATIALCAWVARHADIAAEAGGSHAETLQEMAQAAKREHDLMRVQLSQARALLEDVNVSEPTASWVKRRDAFLARAPAQAAPRTTALLCYEGDCAKMTGRARPCPVHDAPAQTAEPALVVTELDCSSADVLQAMRDGLSPAEFDRQCQDKAWLAALTEQVERLSRLSIMRSWDWDAGEVYCASSVDDIASELTDLLRARKGDGNG